MEKKIKINIYVINFLLAVSSTIGMTIIPLIVVDSLGLSLFILGIIEGLSEFFASTLRLYSGIFFDKHENKFKLLLYPVYAALVSKLILLQPSTLMVITTKLLERLSNGAFGPIRDALILKLSSKEGKDLSLLNISKSAGCLIGPLIVTVALSLHFNINNLIMLCIIICIIATILTYYLKTISFSLTTVKIDSITLKIEDFYKLNKIYPILILSSLFFLCRFNDGLIIIFLRDLQAPQWLYISTIGIFNAFMLMLSPFIGKCLDKGYIKFCIYFTLVSILIFNFLCIQLTTLNIYIIFLALFFWGAQRVCSQMTFLFIIKQQINSEYLGRAIGVYSLLSGISLLIAAFICGYLAKISFLYVFIYGALMSSIAIITAFFLLNNILNKKKTS